MEERMRSLNKQLDLHLLGDLYVLNQSAGQNGVLVPAGKENLEEDSIAASCGPQPWAASASCPLSLSGGPLLGVGPPRRRQGAPRRPREFTPEEQKEAAYWSRRRRNNEAARRSRHRRRLQELHLEARALELLRENEQLRSALGALYCPLVPTPPADCCQPQQLHDVRPPTPPHGAQVPHTVPYRPWVDPVPQPCDHRGHGELKPWRPAPPAAPLLPHKLRHKGLGATEIGGDKAHLGPAAPDPGFTGAAPVGPWRSRLPPVLLGEGRQRHEQVIPQFPQLTPGLAPQQCWLSTTS